jgi:hypothetical protein
VALALLSAGALTGCGGAGAQSTQSAQSLVRETFESRQPIDSGRMKLSAALSGTGSTAHGTSHRPLFSVLIQGPFQSLGPARPPSFALLVDVSAGGLAQGLGGRSGTVGFGATSTGGQLFLELDGKWFVAPASAMRALERGYRQTAHPGTASAPSVPLAVLGVDPGRWLTSPTLVGSATIAGEPTLHVVAELDAQRFLADAQTLLANGGALGLGAGSASARLTPARLSALSHSLRSARVDVFTGARDHRLRRLSVSASLLAGARARRALDGLPTARLTFVLEFADLDRPQRIAAPRDPLAANALGAAFAHS